MRRKLLTKIYFKWQQCLNRKLQTCCFGNRQSILTVHFFLDSPNCQTNQSRRGWSELLECTLNVFWWDVTCLQKDILSDSNVGTGSCKLVVSETGDPLTVHFLDSAKLPDESIKKGMMRIEGMHWKCDNKINFSFQPNEQKSCRRNYGTWCNHPLQCAIKVLKYIFQKKIPWKVVSATVN